jgi:AcrR family transcriptional regulator
MMRRCAAHGHTGMPVAPYFTGFVEGRRGEILDAAMSVFAEKGYEGGTMREIATRLGVTEPALYRHYAGKEALFEDLVSVASDRVVTKAGIMLDGLEPETLHSALLELIRVRRAHKSGDGSAKPIMAMLFAAAPHNAAFREVFRTHLARPMLDRLGAFVPRVDDYYGIERTPESLTSNLRAFLSLFVGYFMTGMMLELPDDDEAIVDAMMAIMGWEERAPIPV